MQKDAPILVYKLVHYDKPLVRQIIRVRAPERAAGDAPK